MECFGFKNRRTDAEKRRGTFAEQKMKVNNYLKLISLNIELNRHYDVIFPFLKKERPDVVCLQEVVGRDMPLFIEALGMSERFEPMVRAANNSSIRTGLDNLPVGLALFSRFPSEFRADYYAGQAGIIPEEREDNQSTNLIMLRA